jgi:hypothetical protein
MFGGSEGSKARGTPALITGLTLLALGAMAAAIPPARLTPEVTGFERGYLVSGASFSDMMAEILNGNGYTYMAIDLTRADLDGPEIWRVQFDDVSRIFPVWGWVDVRGGTEQARKVAASLPLSGLYLHGAKPEDADAVRAAKPGLRVVRVGEDATLLGPDRFAEEAPGVKLPVLLASSLKEAEIAALRAKAPGDYLVCSIAILP